MRAWGDLPGDDPKRDREEKEAAIEAAGIDLDPVPPGFHRHDDEIHASDHAHPHHHSEPGQPPVIGIIGAGAVGTALGVALTRAGWPVHAVASRDPERRQRFHALVDGSRMFSEGQAVVEEVELVLLTVPDDAVASVAAGLRMYGGQAMVHTSGALDADVLAPAMAAGTQIGAFHPLVAFADTERSVAALKGATVAIEGDDQLAGLLATMAEAIGAHPVRLARDRRPRTTPRRSSPRVASSRSSTRSSNWVAWLASTRPGRWPSTAPSSRAPLAMPGHWASVPP